MSTFDVRLVGHLIAVAACLLAGAGCDSRTCLRVSDCSEGLTCIDNLCIDAGSDARADARGDARSDARHDARADAHRHDAADAGAFHDSAIRDGAVRFHDGEVRDGELRDAETDATRHDGGLRDSAADDAHGVDGAHD